MSENNTNKNIDFNDEKEPIESIEKTVEDLKKKIQELSEEKEVKEAEEEVKEVSEEAKTKIKEIKDSTVDTLSTAIKDIKEKASTVSENPDVQKTIAYIKENAVKAVDSAKVKIAEIQKDPKFKEYTDKAVETAKNAGDSVSKFVDEHLDEKTKGDLKNAYDTASKAVVEGSKKVVTAANDFYNKPEVQETIEKVKTGANEVFEKGSEAVKNFFNKEEK